MMDKDYSLLCKYKNDLKVEEKSLNFSILKTIGRKVMILIDSWQVVGKYFLLRTIKIKIKIEI